MRTLRWTIGVTLLLFQLAAIGYARFVPSRYFCWAPFDMQTEYRLDVAVNGRKLSVQEIQQRYRRPAKGIDNRSTQHLIDLIVLAEERYHEGDVVEALMIYRVNGKEWERWDYRRP